MHIKSKNLRAADSPSLLVLLFVSPLVGNLINVLGWCCSYFQHLSAVLSAADIDLGSANGICTSQKLAFFHNFHMSPFEQNASKSILSHDNAILCHSPILHCSPKNKTHIQTPNKGWHPFYEKHFLEENTTRGGLRTQKQNDSKQIWVIIGLFPFRPLPASKVLQPIGGLWNLILGSLVI